MPNESEQPNPVVIRRRKKETGVIEEIRKEDGKIIEPNPKLIGGITEEEAQKKELATKNAELEKRMRDKLTDFFAKRK